MNEDSVWMIEKRLWLEGASAYEDVLDPACLMAFPGIGVMRAPEVLESLRGAPPWQSVQMTEQTVGRTGVIIILGYRAEGRSEGREPYHCFCTSTYQINGGRWRIVQHQQTLAG